MIKYFLSLTFLCAIIHTFLSVKIHEFFHHKSLKYENKVPIWIKFGVLLGEIEIVFILWAIPLLLIITCFQGPMVAIDYLKSRNYTEPIFVIAIMTVASSGPVLLFAENILKIIAKLGKQRLSIWWFVLLTVTPLLGSFITEPAAMTIAAVLLSKKLFDKIDIYEQHSINSGNCGFRFLFFRYATLGLLFVNISIGGVLTHFAAPPVLMVARTWSWDTLFMLRHFGWESMLSILLSTTCYALIFKKELSALDKFEKDFKFGNDVNFEKKTPNWIIFTHILFVIWTVYHAHNVPWIIVGLIAFYLFVKLSNDYQKPLKWKESSLVGIFLTGLIIHGGMQVWWLEPIISKLGDSSLFYGATILTAFNDNAAITYLASLIPQFSSQLISQISVVSGAIAGGGLTVIANAPNPAGQSILSKHFKEGVSPLYLFLGALIPTLFVIFAFRFVGLLFE